MNDRNPEGERAPRVRCPRCRRPGRFCYCARVPTVSNRTPIFAVQHVRERAHPYGTLRLAALGLERIVVVEGRPEAPPPSLPPGAALLFPSPDATDLGTLPRARHPAALVLLDGTWSQARKLLRSNHWLAELPRVRLTPAAPSNYRIRREPRADYVSTVESLVAALELLEPETPGLRGLLDAFDGMVDDVVRCLEEHGKDPRFRRGPAPRRRQLRPLISAGGRLVVVYGEGTRDRTEGDDAPRRLVAWSALRLGDGARFDRLVHTPEPLGAPRLHKMGLPAAAFEAAPSEEEVRDEWAAWRRPDDVLTAWNPTTVGLLPRLGEPAHLLSLKEIMNRWRGGCPGGLDDQLHALGVAEPPPLGAGRPGARLACAVALAQRLMLEGERA